MVLPSSMLWIFLVSFRRETAKTFMLSSLTATVIEHVLSLFILILQFQKPEKPAFLTCPFPVHLSSASNAFLCSTPPEAPDSWNLPPRLMLLWYKNWLCFGILNTHDATNNPPLIHCVSLTDAWSLIYFVAQLNVHVSVWIGVEGILQ